MLQCRCASGTTRFAKLSSHFGHTVSHSPILNNSFNMQAPKDSMVFWYILQTLPSKYRNTISKFFVFNQSKTVLFETFDDEQVYLFGKVHKHFLPNVNYTDEPVRIPELCKKRMHKVVYRATHMWIQTKSGELYGWGRNVNGSVSYNPTVQGLPSPQLIRSDVVQFDAGFYHAISRDLQHEYWLWGQLINPSLRRITLPEYGAVKLQTLFSRRILHVVCGMSCILVLCDNALYILGSIGNKVFGEPTQILVHFKVIDTFSVVSNSVFVLTTSKVLVQIKFSGSDLVTGQRAETIHMHNESLISMLNIFNFPIYTGHSGYQYVWDWTVQQLLKTALDDPVEIYFLHSDNIDTPDLLTIEDYPLTVPEHLDGYNCPDNSLCLTIGTREIFVDERLVNSISSRFISLHGEPRESFRPNQTTFWIGLNNYRVYYQYTRYLYTRELMLDLFDVFYMWYLASESGFEELVRKCQTVILDVMSEEEIGYCYFSAEMHHNQSVTKGILPFIIRRLDDRSCTTWYQVAVDYRIPKIRELACRRVLEAMPRYTVINPFNITGYMYHRMMKEIIFS